MTFSAGRPSQPTSHDFPSKRLRIHQVDPEKTMFANLTSFGLTAVVSVSFLLSSVL